MLVGLDRLSCLQSLISQLKTGRIGLMAHPASVQRGLVHISRVLAELDIVPRRIFGPEHGYGGEAQDMIGVDHARDPLTGAQIVSLYGNQFEDLIPKTEQLQDLDVLLIDLCDIGSRYYTFVWTSWLAIQKAVKIGVRCVLLDRPNPLGGLCDTLEGKPQQPGYCSFVGLEPLPVRHSLTIGEIIGELASQNGIDIGRNKALEIVRNEQWDRSRNAYGWDRCFVMPSPNMPTIDTAIVYPGGCLLEGTNLSEGRGTTRPFEIFGAPWLDGNRLANEFEQCKLPGVVLRPMTFQPTFHKHAGKICGGAQVHVTNPAIFRAYASYIAIIALVAKQAPEYFRFRTERYEFVDDIAAIDLLSGSNVLRDRISKQVAPMQIVEELCEVSQHEQALHERAVARLERYGT